MCPSNVRHREPFEHELSPMTARPGAHYTKEYQCIYQSLKQCNFFQVAEITMVTYNSADPMGVTTYVEDLDLITDPVCP